MRALELLKSQEPLLLEDGTQGKKTKVLASTLNQLMAEMNAQITSFEEFKNSELNGDMANKIIIAKSLAEYFAGNKLLKVELAVEGLRNQEKAKIAEYYAVKNKLLDTIRTLIKEASKEAVVSNYDIFEGNFVKCENGHEIIILGERNINVLETLLNELDEQLTVEGNFDNVNSQAVDFNLATLNRNVELCQRKADEIYGAKAGKLTKVEAFIAKFEEVGKQVVAFYSYKEALLEIGCAEKGVNAYEHELSKAYIPLKKTLSKELKTELEDICNVSVNEAEYPAYNVEEPAPSFESIFESNSSADDNNVASNMFEQAETPVVQQSPVVEENPADPFVNLSSEQPSVATPETNANPFESIFEPSNTEPIDVNPASPFANTPFGSNNDDDNRI